MKGPLETEVKIRLTAPHRFPSVLRELGFEETRARVFEANTLFDTEAGQLRKDNMIVRLREAGFRSVLTWKGKSIDGPHKSRPEIESEVDSPQAVTEILHHLGFYPVFRYEKYRTEFTKGKAAGIVTYDETPVGEFLELEGEAGWIDSTATELGFKKSDYILESYGKLFAAFRAKHNLEGEHMVFGRAATSQE